MQLQIRYTRQSFIYQDIAEKALHLRQLGMSASAIAQALHVSDKTVAKAIQLGVPGKDKKVAKSP